MSIVHIAELINIGHKLFKATKEMKLKHNKNITAKNSLQTVRLRFNKFW